MSFLKGPGFVHDLSGASPASVQSALAAATDAQAADMRESLSALGYNPASSVVVVPIGTDLQRGTALVAAYAAAKLLTPGGAALSATNRVAVVIPPGKYRLTASLVLDTDFVDLFAMVPEKPSRRRPIDEDGTPDEVNQPSLASYRPGNTVIYSEVDYVSTVVQTCDNLRMSGFTISHLGHCIDFYTLNVHTGALGDYAALFIGQGSANGPSQYADMFFWTTAATFPACGGVRAYTDFAGTWLNCVSNSASFRSGFGNRTPPVLTVFSANMYDCEAGPYSFIGDYLVDPDDSTVVGSRFERCKCLGYGIDGAEGVAGFAGCGFTGVELPAGVVFMDCESGENSFGIGNTIASTFIRCRAGVASFGSTNASGAYMGTFSGYAEDCIAGNGSFGGKFDGAAGKCSGTLVRCTVTGNVFTMSLEGAKIRGSRITCTETGINALTLLDSNSKISDTDIIVFQGGSGVPIYAASARNVAAYHCRMNNFVADADGLHANVTNLVTTPNNVISNSVA